MSAYAALKAQEVRLKSPFDPPKSQCSLLESITTHSNFTPSHENTIYTASSVYFGLTEDNHIVAVGTYELLIHRGTILINNVHEVKEGSVFPIVVSGGQSPPLICPSKSTEAKNKDTNTISVLPHFETVLELRNLHTGLLRLGQYCPLLKTMYYEPTSNYTFRLVTEPEENLFAMFFNASTMKSINSLSMLLSMPTATPESVIVVGSKNCGKSTFSKTLMNNVVNATKKQVAYMDLDPSNSEYSIPGTISLTVHTVPTFGLHFAKTNALDNVQNMFCYYGFASAGDLPVHYLNCCRSLVAHYTQHLYTQGMPLIVNTPGWVRGLGKDFLIEITKLINPNQLVYLTHNDAINVGEFEADEFESQDNPDDEVVSGLVYQNLVTIKATRISSRVSSSLTKLHHKLLYFHHGEQDLKFNFEKHILFNAPTKLYFTTMDQPRSPAESVAGVFALGYDLGISRSTEEVVQFAEVSIMGLCLVPESDIPLESQDNKRNIPAPKFYKFSDYTGTSAKFACLCMVHSINTEDAYFNVYLPTEPGELSKSIMPYLEEGYRMFLTRGEGEIPSVEILMPELVKEGQIPYVTSEPRLRIGGIWKPRKNLGRKNQK